MARVLLILPRLPQRMGAPYLGQQYIAASLLRDGHEVRCLDLAATRWTGTDDDAERMAREFAPDLVGMTLFTYNAARGYALARRLAGLARLTVAGGPHVTVDPREPVAHGFDVAVAGEGEQAIVALARFVDRGLNARPDLPGLTWADGISRPYVALDDLNALAYPYESYGCFDMAWYSPDGQAVVPGGLMTSRGCPARCTFCANYVTGRAYRWRTADNVVAEMAALAERHGVRHFPFWDDAFTALRPRLNALCDAIAARPELDGATWSCITPGNMVKPHDLQRMRRAGCVAINFGLESGDPQVLRDIQKGQRPDNVRAAVAAAKAEGMTTIVNFMFGFPGEGVEQLQRTLDLMIELSEATDYFNTRGVLVPFPGTAIYDRHHAEYGFTRWWLDAQRIVDEPNAFELGAEAALRESEVDPTLALDYFRYSDAVRDKIAECVRFKAQHNQRTIRRFSAPTPLPAPAEAAVAG